MKKSFIERIFPHSPGSTLPQYEDDYAVRSPSRSPLSPPRILLQDSTVSPLRGGSTSNSPPQSSKSLSASLVRYNDPFLPVERAAKSLERTFQSLLDAQSEGLSAGVGSGQPDDTPSVGSPTPTPSVTSPSRGGPKTIPIRQPKSKRITLRGARRGLAKSMVEYAALKEWELSLIDQEVIARDNALKQASDLGNRQKLLEDEIQKVNTGEQEGVVSLRSEVQNVDREIQQLETALLELRSRHRQLVDQLRQVESSRDSELSSYTESLALNKNQVKSFLHQPPIPQSLSTARDPGMYALTPDRRTLKMAEEQWTSELETLSLRKSDVTNEKHALEAGSKLWRELVKRITEFEKTLRSQTNELSQSELHSTVNNVDWPVEPRRQQTTFPSTTPEDTSVRLVLTRLSTLITSLERDLERAESQNWNLLICAIGAELSAFEQARDLLRETAGLDLGLEDGVEPNVRGSGGLLVGDADDEEDHQDAPHDDLLTSGDAGAPFQPNGAVPGRQSPGASSNQSLEDTLREFGNGIAPGTDSSKGKRSPHLPVDENADADTNTNTNTQSTSMPVPSSLPQSQSQPQPRGAEIGNLSGNEVNPGFLRPRSDDPASAPAAGSGHRTDKASHRTLESEDEDDPGPEFLLSHS